MTSWFRCAGLISLFASWSLLAPPVARADWELFEPLEDRFLTVPALEPLGAEDIHNEDDRPRIPEPMVFDLVRPLGAKKGEAEVNVLAIIPLNRQRTGSSTPDPVGLTHADGARPEWAPEIEVAILDGVAVEFELPFEDATLRAYKAAGQVTFGTALNDRFIHGAQGILLYDKQTGNWSPTLLYIAGMQFDEVWSALGMIGVRTEINGDDREERTERLFNFSLFRHCGPHHTLGLETTVSTALNGKSDVMLMPQLHWEITDNLMLQCGAGCSFSGSQTLPEAALRTIYSF